MFGIIAFGHESGQHKRNTLPNEPDEIRSFDFKCDGKQIDSNGAIEDNFNNRIAFGPIYDKHVIKWAFETPGMPQFKNSRIVNKICGLNCCFSIQIRISSISNNCNY